MSYRFISPKPEGGVWDYTIDEIALSDAFRAFAKAHWEPLQPRTYAVWCCLRLAAYGSYDDWGPVLNDLHTEGESHANQFACGD